MQCRTAVPVSTSCSFQHNLMLCWCRRARVYYLDIVVNHQYMQAVRFSHLPAVPQYLHEECSCGSCPDHTACRCLARNWIYGLASPRDTTQLKSEQLTSLSLPTQDLADYNMAQLHKTAQHSTAKPQESMGQHSTSPACA